MVGKGTPGKEDSLGKAETSTQFFQTRSSDISKKLPQP